MQVGDDGLVLASAMTIRLDTVYIKVRIRSSVACGFILAAILPPLGLKLPTLSKHHRRYLQMYKECTARATSYIVGGIIWMHPPNSDNTNVTANLFTG